ncbi:type II secretion system F family protein [Rhodoplanes sp. Z2-YC6860]|uniref:type II secretion system F family protein n=1 Tax=Rhodoplanes sp. Z2-YC6860 TaxID=674703 RepID=UPI00078CA8E9|nr:type II secretion system F family protein [Rhodoplanes sp. Z2-YC6860]AMN43701.1 Flp pilus assembly protein TadB [Rhodoplanes sp. Z2-YC6860]
MTSTLLIVVVLALLVLVATAALWFDARQTRMNRQLEIAMPASELAELVSIRRTETASRWQLLHRLANYRAEVRYAIHPLFVLLAGIGTATAVFYANSLFEFSTIYVSFAAAAAAIWVVRSLFGWQQRRLANQLFRQLPDVVQLVTSTVRAGLPVNEALRTVAREMPQPTSGQFSIVCNELNLGRAPEEAIEAVYRRTRVPEYAMFAVTLAVQLKSGGSLAETLQTLGETVNQRVAMAGRAQALAGEVIFSSRALTVMPLIIGGVMYLINPRSIDPLFTDPTGNQLLAYAAGSILVGHFVIRWLIRRETSL